MERVYAALFLAAVGLGATLLSISYGLGSPVEPGAGYFPLILSVLLTVLSLVVALRDYRSRRQSPPLGSWPVRQLGILIAALLTFGFMIGSPGPLAVLRLGLLPATFFLVLIASRASARVAWRDSLLMAAVLSAFSWLSFVKLLGLSLPLWPWSY